MKQMVSLAGQTIHGYEFKELIGSGGFGEVFRAYQPSVDREVAVKVILPEQAAHPDFLARFEVEARTIARLEHPHIVPLHDFWQDSGRAYLSMRFLRGGSLRDRLDQIGALDPAEVGQILEQICSALETAHRQNVIHRDLKPENILRDERGDVYLTDFGIAKDLSADVRTQTGSIMGSLAYISPEQAQTKPLSAAADIYSLGIMLFELLSGKHPFAGLTAVQLLQKHMNSPVPLLSDVKPGLSPAYDLLIQRATAKEPSERYASALDLAHSFRQGESLAVQIEERKTPDFLKPDLEEAAPSHEIFIGRERELDRLDSHLERAIGGRGQIAFVSGGPGRGKTALVSEFARRAGNKYEHLIIASGTANAFSGIGDPYLPFRDILGMLTGDIEDRWAGGQITTGHARALWDLQPISMSALLGHGPELVEVFVDGKELVDRAVNSGISSEEILALKNLVERPAYDGKNIQQAQLFEQYTNVLREVSADRPLLLILDDLQWADGASISLLFHLGRRLENARIFILGTYRGEEVALGREGERHPLEKVLTEFRKVFGEIRIDLSEENPDEDRLFIDKLLDSEPNRLGDSFRDALYNRTEGHALFTRELIRSMQERGDLLLDEDGYWIEGSSLDWDRLPVRVEAVIEERISRLEDDLRELLTVASVEGEDFTVEVLSKVQAVNYRTLLRQLSQQLERRHQLIHERGDSRAGSRILSRYKFSHQLFQRYLYHELSAGERRLLHQEIAETLEQLYDGYLDKITVQLARHYQEAGDEDRSRPYLIRAGQLAKRLFANGEALVHFNQALEITRQEDETYYEILGERAGVLAQLFRGEEAVRDYEELLRHARKNGQRATELDALIGLGRGSYIISIDHPEGGAAHASQQYYEEAYELARELGDNRGMVLALVPTVWFEDFWPEYAPVARRNAEKALEISLADGDEMLIIESELAMFYTAPLSERGERGARLLKKLEAVGNLERLNYLHFGLMFSSLYYGELEAAVEYCDKGIALAKRIGAPPVQYPTIKATALIMLGRFDQAWKSLQEEIADEEHQLATAFKGTITGFYYSELGDSERAVERLSKSIKLSERLSRAWLQSNGHSYLVTCVVEGGLIDAIDITESLEYLSGKGAHKSKVETPNAAIALGLAALATGDVQETVNEIGRAKEYAEKTGRRAGMALAFDLEARLNLHLGEYEKALEAAAEGLRLAEEMDYRILIWRLREKRLHIFKALDDDKSAKKEQEITRELILELAANVSDEDLRGKFLSKPILKAIILPE